MLKSQKIENFMELCVDYSLEGILNSLECCKCEKCVTDIKAMALNNLPPKYIVTEKGQLYAKLNTIRQQFDVDIISAVTNAVAVVSKNPRH